MPCYVALLRGINVGGHNLLPMQKFRDLLGDLGCHSVATYIQSGNAVFRHAGTANEISTAISDAIDVGFGFRPAVLVLEGGVFRDIAAANPFAEEAVEPKTVHAWFLSGTAAATSTESLSALQVKSERFHLTEAAFFLHAPDGTGRSKLAAKVEKCLGVEATARNWRTVGKIAELLEKLDP